MESDAVIFKKSQRVAHVAKFQEDETDSLGKLKKKVQTSLKKRKGRAGNISSDTEDDDLIEFVKTAKVKKRMEQMELMDDDVIESSKIESLMESSSPHIVASGVVKNKEFILPISQESEEELNFPLKLKVKLEDASFYNLRPATRPNQLNEDTLLYKQVRKGYLQQQILQSSSKKKEIVKPMESYTDGDLREASKAMKQMFNQKLNSVNGIVKKEKTKKRKSKEDLVSVDPLMVDKIRKRWSRWTTTMVAPKIIVKIHEKMLGVTNSKFSETENPPPQVLLRPCGQDMDWDEFLSCPKNLQFIPPVTYFKNAPFVDIWNQIAVPGMYIELRNPFVKDRDVFWIGRIVHFAGYKGLVKFESFGDGTTKGKKEKNYLVWISFCTRVPRPLGWCAKNGKELNPGPIVSPKMDASQFAQKVAKLYSENVCTIADDHESMLKQYFDIVKQTWNPAGKYEALDLVSLHQNRLVQIAAIAGNRINVQYYKDEDPEDDDDYDGGFWFHWKSEFLHKFMWSHTVGVTLNGINPAYRGFELPPESFPPWPEDQIKIELGMRLEARHPFLTCKIVGAIIIEVLKYGYFIIQTRDTDMLKRVNFVYHITSPFIFPVGFGISHGIEVEFAVDNFGEEMPATASETAEYLRLDLLPPRTPHNFCVGHKLEAIEVTTSTYIGPATVTKIAGNLLYLFFDGWKSFIKDNYQWVDAEASEIYPAGYAELMGFDWQGRVELK